VGDSNDSLLVVSWGHDFGDSVRCIWFPSVDEGNTLLPGISWVFPGSTQPETYPSTAHWGLGHGSVTLGDASFYAAGGHAQSLAVGDFNADQVPDVAVADDNGKVAILLGSGGGAFGAPGLYTWSGRPKSIATADLSGDQVLDLAVADDQARVAILLGLGGGTFAAPVFYAVTGGHPRSVAIADLNADQVPDLAVADNSRRVVIFLGLGGGVFGTPSYYALGLSHPTSVVIANLNGDQVPDLAVADDDRRVAILLGSGGGVFGAPSFYALGGPAQSVAAGDLDGDDVPDLALAITHPDSVVVLLGAGNGTFGAPTNLAAGESPQAVAIRDMDGDGLADLVVANEGSNDLAILSGTGGGTFGPPAFYGTGERPRGVAVSDLNGDAAPDVLVADFGSDNIGVLMASGGGGEPVFYATDVPPSDFLSGGALHLFRYQGNDFQAPGAALGLHFDYSTQGFQNIRMTDIACTDSFEDWFFGCVSVVLDHDAEPAIPALQWSDGPTSGMLAYWPGIANCYTTATCIDPVRHDAYAVYDWHDNGAPRDCILVAKISECAFEDQSAWSAYSCWFVDEPLIVRNPAVSAYDGNLVMVFEVEWQATPGDRNLACFYSPTGDVGDLSVGNVTWSTASEAFPRLQWIRGGTFLCTYTMDNSLYARVSSTGGASWGPAALVSGGQGWNDTVIGEYRTSDIAESDGEYAKITYEYQDGTNVHLSMLDYRVPIPAPPGEYVVRPDGSGDFPTIQAAINGASPGSVILLADGIFRGDGNRDLDFLGKALTLRSSSGNPAGCILDAEGSATNPHRLVNFVGGEGSGAVMQDLTLQNGWAVDALGRAGGAIWCVASSPTICDCILKDNDADWGGAVFVASGASPHFLSCTFQGNSATYASGAAVDCEDHASPLFTDCDFVSNSAGWGGALSCFTGSTPEFDACRFDANHAVNSGGAMYARQASVVEATECVFTGSGAGYGGACYFYEASNPVLTGCRFSAGHASAWGGGIFFGGAAGSLSSCVFDQNDATSGGGALVCYAAAAPSITGCTFSRNSADYGGAVVVQETPARDDDTRGGALGQGLLPASAAPGGRVPAASVSRIERLPDTPTFSGCTFAGNISRSGSGAGFNLSYSAAPVLTNAILANGQGHAIVCDGTSSAALSCCDVWGNSAGDWDGCIAGQQGLNHNLRQDPRFCGSENPDEPYALRSDSPCAAENNPDCGQIGAWPVGCGAQGIGDDVAGIAVALGASSPSPCLLPGTIVLEIPSDEGGRHVSLNVYDVQGHLVRRVIDGVRAAGRQTALWDGLDDRGTPVAGGVYFWRLAVGGRAVTRQLVVVR
jgi:hypothetical protein